MLARDGLAYAVYQRADARSPRCGRVPAHVAMRLKRDLCLVAFNGDPDRLAGGQAIALRPISPLPVPASAAAANKPCLSVLARLMAAAPAKGVRIRAAAARFLADYHLAASQGRLRTDQPKARVDATARLRAIEDALGGNTAAVIETLVIDRLTPLALAHIEGAGLKEAAAILERLCVLYGLSVLARTQEAGSAFASA